MNVTFNQEAVKEYIAALATKYNTKGKPRQFTTATGNTVTVEGGGYGWKINQDSMSPGNFGELSGEGGLSVPVMPQKESYCQP